MGSIVPVLLVVIFSTLSSSFSYCYAATDTISVNKPMRDGEKIVSASGSYELGFFSPLANSTSQKRYLGIWYKFSNSTVVWVANREAPLNDASGVLQVTSQGILAIRSSSNVTIWLSGSTNASKQVQNPIAQILDTGNFVVREADDTNEDNYLWQSFESPGDTLLPGTRFGKNLVTGVDWKMVSWKSTIDPSFGDSTEGIDVRGYPQLYNKIGETIVFRSGPWNGLNFGGVHGLKPNPSYSYQLVYTEKEIYLNYEVIDKSTFFRMILRNGGLLQKFIWNNNTREWDLEFTSWRDQCDNYALCGAFGSCNISSSPMCNCLEGFTPRFPQDWKLGNWSGGCTRKNDLVCGTGERFQKIDGVKLPDSSKSWFNRTMTLTECERECRRNCSCTAYSTLDISTGFGCLLWFGELLDTRLYDGNGQSFYLKLGTSEPGQIDTSKSFGKKKLLVGIITSSVALIGLLIVGLILYICNKKRRKQGMAKRKFQMFFGHKEGKEDLGFPLFDLATLVKATENFQEDNKLGEGGFGPVFKGTLVDGQEIAVKRLSKNSGQGLEEFKNEVILIAKLQHRNLVRLLGCCVEGDEKMLIYEFMPNKSLDYLIFDQTRTMLDWGKRSHIINGIARGLLYLHQDSRLRVIHRDLKASNILLDANMNPKISDFGLARMFGGDQTEAKTKKVFGTYGYMPPEYAVNGRFSMKSDVFSFGVLVLEIVSGKQNRGFSSPDHSQNLLGHAWELWTQERPLELLYGNLDDVCAEPEVKRCIQVGLLCVQQRPEDRPNMSSVVLMLGSESPLPQPKQPAFFTQMNIPDSKTWSANGMSITLPDPR